MATLIKIRWWIIALGIALATLTLVLILQNNSGAPAQSASSMPQSARPNPTSQSHPGIPIPDNVVYQHDYTKWSYYLRDGGGDLTVRIQYDASTASGIKAYVEANKQNATELALKGGSVEVLIHFRGALQPNYFRQWTKSSGIKVDFAGLWKLGGAKQGGTAIAGTKDDPLPLQGRANFNEFLGVFEVRGQVDAWRLPGIASDPLVFLVDSSSNIVWQDLKSAGFANTAEIAVEMPGSLKEWLQFGFMSDKKTISP